MFNTLSRPQILNTLLKASTTLTLITVGFVGMVAEPVKYSSDIYSEEQQEELNKVKQGQVTIFRYKMMDSDTGSVISVSKIKPQ